MSANTIDPIALETAVKQFGRNKQHALVIGDVMLDRYLIGSVGRISPEAPVPIVLLNQQNERAGGAANVAANLALLGIKTHIIGCVGDDSEGVTLVNLLKKMDVNAEGIYISNQRPTRRLIASPKLQVLAVRWRRDRPARRCG